MLKLIFSLDYEIHGTGEGNPRNLMVRPTDCLLRQFDAHGAKLTIMADVAEILRFRQYAEETGKDDYCYQEIADQLRRAVRSGHDVQLHLHCSYFNAQHNGRQWLQDWSEYDFASLRPERLREVVKLSKEYLESLLQPVNATYKCNVFRAANWSMSPSRNAVETLVMNNFAIDTSIFKYGQRSGLVKFDYRDAHSQLKPWRIDKNDICKASEEGKLVEVPIYSERRWIGGFLSPQRLYRMLISNRHGVSLSANRPHDRPSEVAEPRYKRTSGFRGLTGMYTWKADFNQCTGSQLINALRRAERSFGTTEVELPFVLIGHSKLYNALNALSLDRLLSYVGKRPQRFAFGRFTDVDLRC